MIGYTDLSKTLCAAASCLAAENIEELHGKDHTHPTAYRVAIKLLHLALCESIRDEFFAAIEPYDQLTSKIPIAEQIMKNDFPDHMHAEMEIMVCGQPGEEAPIITINGKEAVSFTHLLSLNPIPAIVCYLDRVCEVMDAADAVKETPADNA